MPKKKLKSSRKARKTNTARSLPTVTLVSRPTDKKDDGLPIEHVSASAMTLFSTNPVLFKIRYINREQIDTATNVSAVIGKAFHRAMETYYDIESYPEGDEAVRAALEVGVGFMDEYPEGWINWSKTVDTRQKASEKVSYLITEFLKYVDRSDDDTLDCEKDMTELVDIEWRGQKLKMPIPLRGIADRIYRDKKGRIKIEDYKTCSSFSDPEKIDACKIIQAVQYYLLAYATYGEEPYSMTYREVKHTLNRDGSPQVREYEVVFADQLLYFDFYLRFYSDMVRALCGEMVYVPNIRAMYDNEVAIVAYIQRLDVPEDAAKLMEKHQVETITELLKKEINTTANIRDLLKSAGQKLATEKTINYKKMTNEEKIRMKLIEHGIVLRYDSLIEGATVFQYRYTPAVGVKMSRIKSYIDDIRQVMETESVRIEAPIPGTGFVGIEIPRPDRKFPSLPRKKLSGLELYIGERVDGKEHTYDLADAPHMLVAGSTGSGKSVFLHSIVSQLLGRKNVKLHICDPKMVEMSRYENKCEQYLNEAGEIALALESMVDTMEGRYANMRVNKLREWDGPRHVIVIDEYADLMFAKKEKETGSPVENLQRLAQKGRAAGIHIVLATQRASVKIISGDIKCNFVVKAVFKMSKDVDSKVMLDEGGAEKLLGKGDMLFATDAGKVRLQGYLPDLS